MLKRALSLVLVATFGLAATAGVRAQETVTRHRERVIIPHELAAEVQRLVHEVMSAHVSANLSRDLSREIGQAMREATRGLSHAGVSGPVVDQRSEFKIEQTDRRTHTVAIGAAGTLELSNVVGDITVKAGSGRDAVVEVVRVSRGRTDADAKLGLEKVTVDVKTTADRASFSAKYPDERRPPYSVSVGYEVTAPAGTRLTVHTVTGQVGVTAIKGELSVSSVSGSVTVSAASQIAKIHSVSGTVTLTDVATDNSVEVGTVAGEVWLKNVKARRVSANSVSGSINAVGIQAGGADLHSMSGEIRYSGPVAANGRYEFQSHSGEVNLGLTGGFDVDATTFSGRLEAEAGLGLAATTGMRQSLRGTVDKGGAAVKVTTFSGNVKLARAIK